jgi:hypothetical protein
MNDEATDSARRSSCASASVSASAEADASRPAIARSASATSADDCLRRAGRIAAELSADHGYTLPGKRSLLNRYSILLLKRTSWIAPRRA